MSAYSAAQNKASQKYKAKAVKRIPLDVPLDEYQDFKTACERSGEKINTVLRELMKQYVKAGDK